MNNRFIPILLLTALIAFAFNASAIIPVHKDTIHSSDSNDLINGVKYYNEQSEKYLDISAKKSLEFAKKALALSEKFNNNYWLGISCYHTSNALFYSGKYEEAVIFGTRALDYLENTDSLHAYFDATVALTSFYRNVNKYYESLNQLFIMLEISGKANDTIYKAKALRNIALTYLSIHDYNNARLK
jgi:tetratricopeptide (TPR) repeat protein